MLIMIIEEKILNKEICIECSEIDILKDYIQDYDVILEDMATATSLTLKKEGVDFHNLEISLTFTSLDEIKNLNRDYRGNDKITDVLSFPQYENLEEIKEEIGYLKESNYEDNVFFLGDVVIALEKVKEQSEEFNHSFQRELMYLYIHSILHLLGFDHIDEGEKDIMRRKEEIVLEELKKYER